MVQVVAESAQDVGGGTLGAQLANKIEEEIRRKGWREGYLIGSESDLTTRFEVGVAAVREASRILEARGLARVRRGPGGGLSVTTPDRGLVTDAARRHLEHVGVERDELFAVWLALEQLAVTKLVAGIEPVGADRLRAVLRREDQHRSHVRQELPNIHMEIARQAGNRALELFIEVLTQLCLTQFAPGNDPQPVLAWLHARHEEIVEAIIGGDVAMAQLHLRRLIDEFARPDGKFSS